MNRSLSWIDPAEVQQALSRAHRAPGSQPPAAASSSAAAPSSSFPTFAPPVSDRGAAEGAGDLEIEEAPATGDLYSEDGSTLPRAEGSIAERIRSLAVWVESEIGPARWFLADEQGMGLHVAGTSETEVVGAAVLARALRPLRGFIDADRVEAVTLELAGGRTLYTLWCDTGLGRVALGLQDPRSLTAENVQTLRRWLRDALDT